jgi:Beta-lactamase
MPKLWTSSLTLLCLLNWLSIAEARVLFDLDDEQVRAAILKLEPILQNELKRTGIPGAAVAIVHSDRVLYLQGYGVRTVGESATVDADTVFQMAPPAGAHLVRHPMEIVLQIHLECLDVLPVDARYEPTHEALNTRSCYSRHEIRASCWQTTYRRRACRTRIFGVSAPSIRPKRPQASATI